MTRQNLRDREVAIALSELSGKLTITEIRDHLKSRGLITVPEDLVGNYECELARKAIQRSRKYDRPDGQGRVELVNLYEWTKDNVRNQYYRNLYELTPDEGVQICSYWHDSGRRADKELLRIVKVMTKLHGKRFQKRLPFELPTPKPVSV